MKPIKFEGSNCEIAKDQPEYLTLPAYRDDSQEVQVTSCWKLSFRERIKILFTGKMWLRMFTFGHALQPQLPMVDNPFKFKKVVVNEPPAVVKDSETKKSEQVSKGDTEIKPIKI